MSLSAFVSECVSAAQQFQARTEYLDWAFGAEPITAAEMEAVDRELKGLLAAPVERKRASGE